MQAAGAGRIVWRVGAAAAATVGGKEQPGNAKGCVSSLGEVDDFPMTAGAGGTRQRVEAAPHAVAEGPGWHDTLKCVNNQTSPL